MNQNRTVLPVEKFDQFAQTCLLAAEDTRGGRTGEVVEITFTYRDGHQTAFALDPAVPPTVLEDRWHCGEC